MKINIPWATLRLLCMPLLISACGPVTPGPSSPSVPSAAVQAQNSTVSEINNALATIAMNTSIPMGDYQIGPEDLLQVTLYNVPTSEATHTPRQVSVRVSQQGVISLPLLGDVKVSGLTPSALERELKTLYEKYMFNPQVGVMIQEYRQQVSVIGSVQRTGVFPLSGPKTVIDILAMAGGVALTAGTQVHIYRQGPQGRESHVIDLLVLASNAALINADNASLITMPVQAGDVINVPPAGTYFVDGAVRNPGPYPLGRRYSLTQALTTAGGVNRELSSSDIFIYRRRGPGQMEGIPIDYDAVMAGSTADPQIEADDIILVPISSAKYVFNRFIAQIIFGGLSIRAFIPAAS
jgi:polysaccharide export outer membrane protein